MIKYLFGMLFVVSVIGLRAQEDSNDTWGGHTLEEWFQAINTVDYNNANNSK